MKIEDILFQNGHIWQGFFIVLKATVEHSRDDQYQQHQILEELLFFSFVFLWLVVFLGKETSQGKEDKPRCWCCENYGGGLISKIFCDAQMFDGLSRGNLLCLCLCHPQTLRINMMQRTSHHLHWVRPMLWGKLILSAKGGVQSYTHMRDIRNTRHKMQGKY